MTSAPPSSMTMSAPAIRRVCLRWSVAQLPLADAEALVPDGPGAGDLPTRHRPGPSCAHWSVEDSSRARVPIAAKAVSPSCHPLSTGRVSKNSARSTTRSSVMSSPTRFSSRAHAVSDAAHARAPTRASPPPSRSGDAAGAAPSRQPDGPRPPAPTRRPSAGPEPPGAPADLHTSLPPCPFLHARASPSRRQTRRGCKRGQRRNSRRARSCGGAARVRQAEATPPASVTAGREVAGLSSTAGIVRAWRSGARAAGRSSRRMVLPSDGPAPLAPGILGQSARSFERSSAGQDRDARGPAKGL